LTASGAVISVPEEAVDLVEIKPQQVIVNDTVTKVSK